MKNSLKFLLLVWVIGISTISFAQTICGPNLVPNHDFEISDPVLCGSSINGVGQLWIDTSQVTSWMGTSYKNGSGNGITPDHFNNSCTGNSGIACMQGNASVGVFTSTDAGGGPQGVREYIQAELVSPLNAGATYYIQMTVRSGSGSSWAHTDGYGAWFRQDTGPFDIGTQGGQSWINGAPQFENPTGNIIDDNCQVISGYFCASGGENWIMLGNFKEDNQLTVSTTTGGGSGSSAYVIVDEIFVQEVCPGTNPPLFTINADPNPLSCGQDVTVQAFQVTSSFGITGYQWISPASLNGSTNLGPHVQTLTQNTTYAIAYTVNGACGSFTDTVSVGVTVNSGVNINLNSLVDETCIGDCDGSIDVTPSGGTPPYSSAWFDNGGVNIGTNNTVSSLCAGDYTFEVTTTESVQQLNTIYTEDFESGSAPGWVLNTNPTGGVNDAQHNEWEVTNQNIGSNISSCTPSTDYTLNLNCPGGCTDEYDNYNTAMMAESPIINTTGYTNLTLYFDFLGEQNSTHCLGTLYYNDGGGWTYLQDLVSATCWGPYNGWESVSVPLPAALNNNPNAQIGFHWYNDTYIITEDWGLAINNISITGETPVNIVCTEIDTFTIATTSCACTPPSLSTSNLNLCTPGNVDLNTAVTTSHTNGTPNVSFYNSQTDADNATNPIGAVISAGGTYYVRSEDPLDPNCFITATITVSETPAPNAGTNGALTICSTDPATDLFNQLSGTPDNGGSWSPALTSGTGMFDPGVDAAGTYTYTVSNSCGTASADVVVTITTNPSAGTNGTATFCSSDTPDDLFNYLGGSPDAGGAWSPALTSGTGVFNPNTDPAGTYTYTLNACGGTATADVLVTVNPAPNAGTSGALTICTTDPATDLFNELGGTPDTGGSWSPALTSGTGMFDPNTDPAGTYTYTVSNSCGTASADVVVTITANPSAGTNGTATFCSSDAPDDLFNYLGGSPDAGGTWSPALNSGTGVFNPNTDPAGTYTYTLNACGGGTITADVVVTVNPAPNAGTNGALTICSTDPATDLFNELGGSPDSGGSWSPALTSGAGMFDPNTDPAGTYTYTVSNSCGTVSADVVVNIDNCDPPTANFEANTLSVCFGDCITLTDLSTGTIDTWEWNFGGAATPNTSSDQNPTICPDSIGTFDISLTVSNGFGTDTYTTSITVNPIPTVFAGADTTIDMNTTVLLTATGTPPGGTYLWNDPDLDCPECSLIEVAPVYSTYYTVIYTTSEGCLASDEILVTVLFEEAIGVPNGFSPNADGMNDVLFVEGVGITNMSFVVYNRYGNKVFESTKQEVGWDGSFNGHPENPGVFAWYLSYTLIDGSTGTKSGNVTLIK